MPQTYHFDFSKRSEVRALEQTQSEAAASVEFDERVREAEALEGAIMGYYGPRQVGQFTQSRQDTTVSITKKAGGSTLKIEVLGNNKFKLSGGSGPGGFAADVAVSMNELSKEEMRDTVDEWFALSAS